MKLLNGICLFAAIIFNFQIFAQSNSNLDQIYSLIDESFPKIIKDLPFEEIAYSFNYNSVPEYNYLKNHSLNSLSRLVSVTEDKSRSMYDLSYNIDDVSTKYFEPEKNGFFGSYIVGRKINLKGAYTISSRGSIVRSDKFDLSLSDTVDYYQIKDLESISLSFTRGEIPEEPFFASLLEPAIAICAIAVTIILFFTVRSN